MCVLSYYRIENLKNTDKFISEEDIKVYDVQLGVLYKYKEDK